MSPRHAVGLDIATASNLMTMGDHPRAESQLAGAVALHNILERERVGYLADEVGLGKTYVALATLALFRHFDPGFRALIIAPKANIQTKWRNDWNAFVRTNWHEPDLRVKGASGGAAREVILPDRLSDFVYETLIDDDRDFICRLPSFSFALAGSRERIVASVRRALPWLSDGDFPRDPKSREMRDFVAQAYNAALPRFDLVIIDEAHNLGGGAPVKDGVIAPTAHRNAVLAQVLGHREVTCIHPRFAASYGPLAERVLMLSATPIETSYTRLWNQLQLVDKAESQFEALRADDELAAIDCARRIMVRRINALPVNGKELTKNLYRRTWHQGGVAEFDDPLPPGSPRERLTIALVQKRVAEEIGAKFNDQFQMGMLASFESFGQTALARPASTDEQTEVLLEGAFVDDSDQAETAEERAGLDTDLVNRLAQSHVRAFGREMAHPKMDAVVAELGNSWERGDKALVFVRRIASVKELKRKLDERYDAWLFARLERDLPDAVWQQIDRLRELYRAEHIATGREGVDGRQGVEDDAGGADTFFSWFFRGQGPSIMKSDASYSIESGASIAQGMQQAAGSAATFFAHHYVCELLECSPSDAWAALLDATGLPDDDLAARVVSAATPYVPASAGRRHRFEAVQTGCLRVLSDGGHADARRLLAAIGHTRESNPGTVRLDPRRELEWDGFFSRIRRFPELAKALRVSAKGNQRTIDHLQKQALADQLLATASRRGHALIDLYISMMRATGAHPLPADTSTVAEQGLDYFLETLDLQRRTDDRSGAFWELSQIVGGNNLDLILDKNFPETRTAEFLLTNAPTLLGRRLGSQQPTVGMVGRVNATAVQQFRMPGYPHVLVCTDVLKEGEDLHLFCDRVVHYGVAWTPSALEQRNGRVDRLYSMAERRFTRIDAEDRDLEGGEQIQVQIPYLPDTIEVLQSRRVIESMHRFTELMHHNVDPRDKRIDITAEMQRLRWQPPTVSTRLESAFPVMDRDLAGSTREPATPPGALDSWWNRLSDAVTDAAAAGLVAGAEHDEGLRAIYCWRRLTAPTTGESRVQPFTLKLSSLRHLPLVQAMTPVGRVTGEQLSVLHGHTRGILSRITLTEDATDREYNVAIEGDVILGDKTADQARIHSLIERVTADADRVELATTGLDLTIADVDRTLRRDVLHDV